MYREYYLSHEGRPHDGMIPHSGRHPWGSGENPYQHRKDILGQINRLKEKGFSERERAEYLGFDSINELRDHLTDNKAQADKYFGEVVTAAYEKLKDSNGKVNISEVAKETGFPYSNVSKYLKQGGGTKTRLRDETIAQLKEVMKYNDYLDVGYGEGARIGVSQDMLNKCVNKLVESGEYGKLKVRFAQNFSKDKTTEMIVLTKDPKATERDVRMNPGKIAILNHNLEDADGNLAYGIQHPVNFIDSKRVQVRYAEDGGIDKDGIIELRRGVKDLYLGDKVKYSQVRIGVDGTHYLKGVALYSDNMPPGVDVIYNSNKDRTIPKMEVLKKVERDRDGSVSENPFGTAIKRQIEYIENGKTKVSAANIVNEPGDWDSWSKSLSSQFLSKQSPQLAKEQLDIAYARRKAEFDDIMKVDNPVVKKYLLDKFADGCDSAAVHLKAAELPGQRTKVIIPFPKMKENEIYAPDYENGTQVALVRYPHGAIFEIPILTVNNNYSAAKKAIGVSRDAVGFNPRNGEQLSGADYDGDTAVVIPIKKPNGRKTVDIRTDKYPDALVRFDPKVDYKTYKGSELGLPDTDKDGNEVRYNIDGKVSPIMSEKAKGTNMGKITNLIADMGEAGADREHIIRAIKHSMVVIDAPKHKLDYTRSYKENGIAELNKLYRGSNTGASTIITRAKSPEVILDRKEINPIIDSKTGELKNMTEEQYKDWKAGKKIYTETGKKVGVKVGENPDGTPIYGLKEKTVKVPKMMLHDPKDLIGTPPTKMQVTYANYAAALKSLGNQARKEYRSIPNPKINPQARKIYEVEVNSLDKKVKTAEMNAPLERKANTLATELYWARVEENPGIREDPDWNKKVKQDCMNIGRARVGKIKGDDSKTFKIPITRKEWEAVQAGALSKERLEKLLRYTNIDTVREYSTPRETNALTPGQIAMIKAMNAAGNGMQYTQADIAKYLGISVSSVKRALYG